MNGWLRRLTEERMPAGTGWSSTLGMVLLFGLILQIATGIVLALYYAPTPDHAWTSVQYIMTSVRGGAIVRGLHYWGSSAVVIAAVLHLIRVVITGGYRKPRQLNWVVGLLLMQVILGFGMTGYLLPWDQRAFWATVVRVGIARLTPLAGDFAANMLRGGPDLGALTLTRWYTVHVMVLPIALFALVAVHLWLRVRDGLAGPSSPRHDRTEPYFPNQVARDVMMCLAVGVVLSVLAWKGMPALEPQADPTASDYIPRPEWYFAGLFQFVKLFPGKFEVIGALVIPGIAMTAMMLLPWLDGGKTRAIGHRRGVIAAFSAGMAAVATLTIVGALDQPVRAGAGWNPREIAGMTLMATDRCARCHKPDGLAAPVEAGRISRPQDWVAAHIGDPDMIAAGLRDPPSANPRETQAILAALARLRAGAPPVVTDADRDADLIVTRHCLSCHTIDGVGSKTNDNLTQIGRKHDATWLQQWIADPKAIKADTEMPAFKSKLSPAELAALANWLAAHK